MTEKITREQMRDVLWNGIANGLVENAGKVFDNYAPESVRKGAYDALADAISDALGIVEEPTRVGTHIEATDLDGDRVELVLVPGTDAWPWRNVGSEYAWDELSDVKVIAP